MKKSETSISIPHLTPAWQQMSRVYEREAHEIHVSAVWDVYQNETLHGNQPAEMHRLPCKHELKEVCMTNSVAKTYRLPLALYTLMIEEVENTGVSEADFVRLVLRQHFERRQETSRMETMEHRLIKVIQAESSGITSLLEQVIALAQPE